MSDEREDWRCPRCKDWMESEVETAGEIKVEQCTNCGFSVRVEVFAGRLRHEAICESDHLFESVNQGGMVYTVCQRCGAYINRDGEATLP
jgi:transcription elongation factor Elf1